jgi:hypothetical protein
MIVHKTLWWGTCGVATDIERIWQRCRRGRRFIRFNFGKVDKFLSDRWRERNILIIINDDDLRRRGKDLSIINISIRQGIISHLGPVGIIIGSEVRTIRDICVVKRKRGWLPIKLHSRNISTDVRI